jgi:hypothetical protein
LSLRESVNFIKRSGSNSYFLSLRLKLLHEAREKAEHAVNVVHGNALAG